MRKSLFLAGLLVLLALPAAAQGPRTEVFGGYSYLRLETPGERINLNGWNAAFQGNITDWFGIVGDFSGHYGTIAGVDVNTHQALFGPRLTLRRTLSPFVHVLFGVARGNAGLFGSTESDTALGVAVGGGFDFALGEHLNLRLVQADYLRTELANTGQNNLRISSGIVLRF